ncbi:TMEM175 family protein [Saccharopolyspora sp. NPDC003752]
MRKPDLPESGAKPPDSVELSTNRLELFSDAVFAISITLLILELNPPEPSEHLAGDLAALWPSYLSYVISFLLIGQVWLNHHTMFRFINRVDRLLLLFNLFLLLDVVFLPFATAVLAQAITADHGDRTATVLYGGVLAFGGVMFNAIWAYAAHRHRLLGPGITPEEARRMGRRFRVGPILYFVAALAGFASSTVSLLLYAFLLLLYLAEVAAGGKKPVHLRARDTRSPR